MVASSQSANFWGCDIFFSSSGWLSNQLNFSMAVRIYKVHVFDEAFFLLTVRMPMIFKLFRLIKCCKKLSLNRVVFWNHVISIIHISTCRRCIDTTLGKVLTYCKRHPNMTLWSSDQRVVMWLFEKSISPLSQGL